MTNESKKLIELLESIYNYSHSQEDEVDEIKVYYKVEDEVKKNSITKESLMLEFDNCSI